jgi:exopolyphosphatase/guanosine-5'-triphosphate,3'-diphosphate pyrophosphatase
LPPSQNRRLVIDIGGRSTEIIIGQQSQTLQLASFALGSVSWSNRFFADGVLSNQLRAAVAAAKQALDQSRFAYPGTAWDCLRLLGHGQCRGRCSHGPGHGWQVITLRKLRHLYDQLLEIGHVDKLRMPGLKEDRRLWSQAASA